MDITTGKGIPDVSIISGTVLYSGSSFAGGETLTQAITKTDENGDYTIPNTWFRKPVDLPFRFPGGNTHTRFLVTAFKPGYAFEGDDDAWTVYRESGQPRYLPKSTVVTPDVTWLGPIVKVDDLRMRPVQLTLRQSATYYERIIITASLPVNHGFYNSDAISLRLQANALFQPQVCALDPETILDSWEGGIFSSFTLNPSEFISYIRKVEPSGFSSPIDAAVFHAKNICNAMKAAGEVRGSEK